MTKPILVTIEQGSRKAFASAADWPGWSRSGRTEAEALEALAAYTARYAPIAAAAGHPLGNEPGFDDFDVVERIQGSSGTDFGVPSRPTTLDSRPTDADEAARLASLVAAAWATFDRTARAAPRELRKGPRGGGRDTLNVFAHVMDADRAYAHEIGIKVREFAPDDGAAIRAMRQAMLEVLRAARDGEPLADRRWPARYAAHRMAWHALDHAWEIEDRSAPSRFA